MLQLNLKFLLVIWFLKLKWFLFSSRNQNVKVFILVWKLASKVICFVSTSEWARTNKDCLLTNNYKYFLNNSSLTKQHIIKVINHNNHQSLNASSVSTNRKIFSIWPNIFLKLYEVFWIVTAKWFCLISTLLCTFIIV